MADLVTSRIFTDGEKGITAAKLNDIIASSVIQPAFVGSKPVTSTVNPNDNLLVLQSTNQYAQAPFSTIVSSVQSQLPSTDAEIWSVRLRSFNSVGNPNFEVDQRLATKNNIANGVFAADRWSYTRAGAASLQLFAGPANTVPTVVPGTNFRITSQPLNITLQAQQASLAAGDLAMFVQQVEGPYARELFSDVSSISLLVQSTVANLRFSVSLRDGGTTTKSLVKLCTVPTSGVWYLITLPNLPVFPSGNFVTTPGSVGYVLGICLLSGATFTAPAADTWQSGNFVAAPGMSNFGGQAVNSQLLIAAVQHEPGPVCTTLMDKTFAQNLDECTRYFTKSAPYNVLPTAIQSLGSVQIYAAANVNQFLGSVSFKKIMAKTPAVTLYSDVTGTAARVRNNNTSTDLTLGAGGTLYVGDSGFAGYQLSAAPSVGHILSANYTADTGW